MSDTVEPTEHDDEPAADLAAVTLKPCPECAEDVRAAARKCRFCGHDFEPRLAPLEDAPEATARAEAVTSTAPKKRTSSRRGLRIAGVIGAALVLLAIGIGSGYWLADADGARERGQEEGHERGMKAGMKAGYASRSTEAQSEMSAEFQRGRQAGVAAGRAAGMKTGLQQGYEEAFKGYEHLGGWQVGSWYVVHVDVGAGNRSRRFDTRVGPMDYGEAHYLCPGGSSGVCTMVAPTG